MSHHHLYRVEELARHFAAADCRVVIHVDSNTPQTEFDALKDALSDTDTIFAERRRCEWGTFALHDASLESARLLIDTFEDVDHVCLISGSCLPIQSVSALKSHLARNRDTDFVDTHFLDEEKWIHGGLSEERFTLFFPFGWQSRRWWFDRAVDLQRRFRIQRTIPQHLRIAVGSQWWTLSRGTLRRILDDPLKPKTDAYFRKCWIVDEAYVQTLVHTHTRRLVNQTLCLSEFDPQGKPFTFYDDHAHLLRGSASHFFARKVWHGASGLYNKYLNGVEPMIAARRPKRGSLDDLVAEGRKNRCVGRPGLLMQSRFPVQAFEPQHVTARPYLVLDGYDLLFEDIQLWQKSLGIGRAHGRIFNKNSVEFDGNAQVMPGSVVANPRIRDWNTEQFLTNLIWHTRDEQQSFQFHVSDSTRMASFILKDPNAHVLFIKGAWALGMTQKPDESAAAYRRRAMRLKLLEQKHINELESNKTRAQVQSWTLAQVIADPTLPLNALAQMIEGSQAAQTGHMPKMRKEHGLNELAYNMTTAGISAPASGIGAANIRHLKQSDTG
ncbi:Core-2/I-Branching enzyme [Monaibacterium marinum]|uniref:Peptide O-xylosyltransferase n=1 Tax=Pontivivens marinum TaxID=1690039 RepID=A0A2C9CNH4_9RHOB|nr:beta-1,6-N-acetylglucosaminyltransferase [Monaibacterium marinum]SOH93081.1 Core-2/I-Branching enzyme [Monaibacterium marinum]